MSTPRTRTVRAGIESDPHTRAVVPPLHMSTNYAFEGLGRQGPWDYSRAGNPTRGLLSDALADLEGGAGAVVTASGLGAISAVLSTLLRVGDTLVAPHDCYGGSLRLFEHLQRLGHFELVLIDFTDLDRTARVIAERKPAVVWLETPSNPLLRITDLAAVAEMAAKVDATVVADNTFCSPLLQQPLSLGADVVVHSCTKFLNGHSDVVSGAAIAADPDLADRLAHVANVIGITSGAMDSWMVLRGLRTLHARMRAHQENTAAIVDVLTRHPAVQVVHYPGLPDHPGHELAARQQSGFGSMVSFEVAGMPAVEAFLDNLECFSLAESLGGTESLVSHSVSMTHASMSAQALKAAGINSGLLRLSIGIEDPEDLVADLTQALDQAQQAG